METQRKIVYKGEMKGISFYGSQAGDLHFPPWSVYSDGHFLKEKEKKKIFHGSRALVSSQFAPSLLKRISDPKRSFDLIYVSCAGSMQESDNHRR